MSAHSTSDLVRVFGRIGLLSFGGPAAQISLMHRELVQERDWLSEEDYLRALSFCMLLPGPEAMQLATYAGWRIKGVFGGLLGGLLFVLPGAFIIATLALIYASYGALPWIQALFVGIKATVIVVIIQALLRLSKKALKGRIEIGLAVASFAAIAALGVPFPIVLIVAAAVGMTTLIQDHDATRQHAPIALADTARTTALWLVIWLAPLVATRLFAPELYFEIGRFFAVLAVVSFGGAYALLTYMTQTIVIDFGWLDTGQMVDAMGLAETTPGPLILVSQFVAMLAGYSSGGTGAAILAGLIALWMTFAPCFMFIFVGAPYIDRLASMPRISAALKGITAAIVGVIASLGLWFAGAVFFPEGSIAWQTIAIALVAAALLLWRGWDLLWVLGICALMGLGLGMLT